MNGSIDKLDVILFEAIQIEDDSQRKEFLDRACDDNVELRGEVERLLLVHAKAGKFLEHPVIDRPADHVANREASHQCQPETPLPNAPLSGVLGDYQLIREIGRGGMGVVYEAHQISLNRQVALKVLPFTAVLNQRQLERFKTEAQAAAGLHHGNIVPVFHVGSDRAVHYYAMQYIEGQDVSDLIKQLRQVSHQDALDLPITEDADFSLASDLITGRFEPADLTRPDIPLDVADDKSAAPDTNAIAETRTFAALSTKDATNKPEYFRTIAGLGIQGAEALEFAHQNGILHRDIKPSNLMLDAGGKLWITDFGLARIEGDAGLTMTGDVMGTLRYMSPEQAAGDNDAVDQHSDVYSLGVTLYEMLSLSPVYPAEDRHELLQKRLQEEPAPLRQVNKAIPADLETIVHKAIAKEPVDRYATAQEFADDLQRFLNGEAIHARRPSVATRFSKWSQRNRALAAALFAAAFIGGIVAAGIVVVVKDRDGNVVAKVSAPAGSRVDIEVDGRTTSPPVSSPVNYLPSDHFVGLMAYPQSFSDIGRWQVVTRLPRSFVEHNWKFAWSPDSRFLAFGEGDDVRVYSVPDFRLVHLFSGHTGSVVAVDWSLSGKMICSTSIDNTVRIWDAETGLPGPVLVGHRDRVDAVAWHPSSKIIATGGRDNTVRLWNANGKLEQVLIGHTGHVVDVAWSPDGERLASTGNGESLRLWSKKGEAEKVISLHRGENQRTVEWSPDGRRLLTSCLAANAAVRIWNTDGSGGENLKDFEIFISSATWNPDGTLIAAASWDNNVYLFNSDGIVDSILVGHEANVHFVKWSPDGKWIASGSSDGAIRLWTNDGKPGPIMRGLPSVSKVAWNPDGQEFAIATNDGAVRLCNASGEVERIFSGLRRGFDWSPDGKQIVAWNESHSINISSLEHNTEHLVFTGTEAQEGRVFWNPDGRRIAWASGSWPRATIHFLSLDGTAQTTAEAHSNGIYDMGWNPAGNLLASASRDNWLRLWNVDGKLAREINAGQILTSVAWNPDGTLLASGCDDGTIQLWTDRGKPIRVLKGHENRVTTVKWSSNGKRIASGGRDNTVRLWSDVGSPQGILIGHAGVSRSVDWRPHSAELLSGGYDATVRLWDTKTLQPLWVLVILDDKQSMKLSRDGQLLAGDPSVFQREFRYILQQPTGAIEILKPSDFQQRTSQTFFLEE
ncbi:protein kinase domain-containing protein [Symmachiella dynata]|uniref:protein kinase domain-containing protein n=1 Tax=Symmachiella dynata TaxID=2527995 RepID=UPI0030EDC62D